MSEFPTTFDAIKAMHAENKELKELVAGLMSSGGGGGGGSSTALVEASSWNRALSVEQVMRARAKKKASKGLGKHVAACAASDSEDSEPLPRRDPRGLGIGKKRRKPKDPNAPKKGLTGYTFFVKANRAACHEELMAKGDVVGDVNKQVMAVIGAKWQEVKEQKREAEWKAKAEQHNKEKAQAKEGGGDAAAASPPSVLAADDEL